MCTYQTGLILHKWTCARCEWIIQLQPGSRVSQHVTYSQRKGPAPGEAEAVARIPTTAEGKWGSKTQLLSTSTPKIRTFGNECLREPRSQLEEEWERDMKSLFKESNVQSYITHNCHIWGYKLLWICPHPHPTHTHFLVFLKQSFSM